MKFISGKYQGGEFPLLPDREIVVGRASDLDMVLVEDMVSRKHAKISTGANQVIIQDLGSTNGTFVNGEKIKKTRLKEGDRVLIGTSILKVLAAGEMQQSDEVEARRNLEEIDKKGPSDQSKLDMSGRLDEVPVPDLLQLFGTSKRTGVLSVRSEDGAGKIYLRTGAVFYACINDDHDLGPMKAFCRLVGWEDGLFEFGPPEEEAEFVLELEDTTEALLAEANRQNSELEKITSELPVPAARLKLPRPLEAPLSALTPTELDVVQLVHNFQQMQHVMDKSTSTDFETATALLNLIAQGYIAAK